MTSLSEMPELVMENIIGFLDFRSVLTLRQVCRDFSNFIDDLKDSKLPDSEFKSLEITVKKGRKLEFEIRYFGGSNDIIEYLENSRRFKEKITNLENLNYLDVAIQNDLKWILKFQRGNSVLFRFDSDIYSFHLQPGDEQFYQDVLEKLSNTTNRKIKTKALHIRAIQNSEFTTIIQMVDPKYLEELNFYPICLVFETDQISKTEQWKMAQEFGCGQYFSKEHIKELAHFSKSSILTECVSTEDVIYLKECFVKSPTFQYCYLSMNSTDANRELLELWGPSDVSETDEAEKWYFRMENSDILVITVEKEDTWPYRFYISLVRENISDFDSVGAIIHD